MAIEYLHVLNSNVMDDQCVDEDTEPPTEESTDEPTDETTNDNTTNNSSDNTDPSTLTSEITTATNPVVPLQNQSINHVWMGLSILFLVTTIFMLAGICYFIRLYRRLIFTQSMPPVDVRTINYLPRLQVVNSVNDGDHVIVGIDKKY